MDLGIAGRWAIVCASSQGLGRDCADALAAEWVHVVVNGRDPGNVAQAAAAIRGASRSPPRTRGWRPPRAPGPG